MLLSVARAGLKRGNAAVLASGEVEKMASVLDSCYLKIQQARVHRNALERRVREMFAVETNRPRLGIRTDTESGDQVLFVSYMPDLHDFVRQCSLILGDAVHNLISSLDHLSFQLALHNTNGAIVKPNSVQFPICDTPTAFKHESRRRLKEVSGACVELIEQYQPYHPLDESISIGPYFHPLAKLRDLASVDKHRLPIELIVPTNGMTWTHPGAFEITLFGMLDQIVRKRTMPELPPAELGAEIMRARFPPGLFELQEENVGFVTANVAVDRKYGAIALLDKSAAVVERVIREFGSLLERS